MPSVSLPGVVAGALPPAVLRPDVPRAPSPAFSPAPQGSRPPPGPGARSGTVADPARLSVLSPAPCGRGRRPTSGAPAPRPSQAQHPRPAPRPLPTPTPGRGPSRRGFPAAGRACAVTCAARRRPARSRNGPPPPSWRLHRARAGRGREGAGPPDVTSPGRVPLAPRHAPQAPPPARGSRLLASSSAWGPAPAASPAPNPSPAFPVTATFRVVSASRSSFSCAFQASPSGGFPFCPTWLGLGAPGPARPFSTRWVPAFSCVF